MQIPNHFELTKEFEFGKLYTSNKLKCILFRFNLGVSLKKDILEQQFNFANQIHTSYSLITVMEDAKPTSEAYTFYSSKDRADFITSEAFVLTSKPLMLAANFYYKMKRTSIPSKVFSSISDAVEWMVMQDQAASVNS